jgi:hypothetical protein
MQCEPDGECVVKRRVYNLNPPGMEEDIPVCIMSACACNEAWGIATRVLGETPDPTSGGKNILRSGARILGRRLQRRGRLNPISYEEVVSRYSGGKRAMYDAARESLLSEGPVTFHDTKIKAFVKGEKVLGDVVKDPRIIQGRSPRYNLSCSRWMKPIEDRLYSLNSFRWQGLRQRLPLFAKCANSRERARVIRAKWSNFEDPVCMSLDASRFDKHVSVDALRAEHAVYQMVCDDPEFQSLLSWQLKNHGKSSAFVRYVVDGRRMSGDPNTALGNCTVTVIVVIGSLKGLKLKFDIYDDGDDCLLFCERKDLERIRKHIVASALECGFVLKVEKVASHLQDIVFCQCRMTLTAFGWSMVRDYRKVCRTASSVWRHLDSLPLMRGVIAATGQAELALNPGVPVLQELSLALIRCGNGAKLRFDELTHRHYAEWGGSTPPLLKAQSISVEARVAFERTWGLSPDAQIALESRFASWDPILKVIDYEEVWIPGEDGVYSAPAFGPFQ